MEQSQRWFILAGVLVIAGLVYLLQSILMPFLLAALLAYLGDPLVDRMEAHRLPRSAGVTIVFVALALLLLGLILMIAPLISEQIQRLREFIPQFLTWIQQTAIPWIERQLGLSLTQSFQLQQIGEALVSHWRQAGDIVTRIIKQVSSSGLALLGFLANMALVPVVAFYLLRDWDKVVTRLRDLLPRPIEPTASRLTAECDEVLGAFLRGQFLVMVSLGVIYAFGLWLLGLDLALLIGMVAGLASIVPYLGTILGFAAALIAALVQFGDWWHLLGVAAVFGIGQMLEGMVLTPLLVGDRIGLHPVAVIFAVLAGGALFGFTGVLLALPVAAVVMVLLRDAHARYKHSRFYGTEAAETGGESDA